jgi:hypothetical protein
MSRKSGILAVAAICLASAAVIVAVRPVQGAKQNPPLSLKASFDELWVGEENLYRIQNDASDLPYVDTPDQKVGKQVVKSGVEVKYYPPSGYYKNGKFTMTIDQSGSLQRFVRLHFLEPSTDPASENESQFPGLHVDPLWGSTGTLLTSKISFTSWGPLKADEQGILRFDTDTSLDMDKMQAGKSKYIDLVIEFNPMGEFINQAYYLGVLQYVSLRGAAELYCVEAGQVWEIRPFTETFTNEPDNSWRLLHTNVQIDYLRTIKLRSWHMPFVLRITR